MRALTPDHPDFQSHLRADQSERWQQGEQVRIQYYLEQFPSIEHDSKLLLDLIFSELLHRLERGERPALGEYLDRFPQHAAALGQYWTQLEMMHPQFWLNAADALSTDNPEPTVITPRLATPRLSLPGLELQDKLGEGAMGVVYRARDIRLEQPRAIKFISSGPFAGAEARKRFSTEAKAIARLNHPGVVRIFAMGDHEGVPYICMELLTGGTLRDRLHQGGPLEIREAVDLVRQLALAMDHAHAHSILHRDLKPANVLLTDQGAPKITDFGLAKVLDSEEETTETGQVLGTPSYMAPEQADPQLGAVSEQTDVYALGVILYQCLLGKVPFRGENRAQTLYLVKTQQPPPFPRTLRSGRLLELEAVCAKCLEKEPGERYLSASALAADLQNWLDNKPVGPRPKRGLRRVLHNVRRRPRIAWFVVVLLLAVLSGGLLAYLGHPDRPLWRIQAQIVRNESVDLIGPTGKPPYYRWWTGEKNGKAVLGDGVFGIHGWPITCIELLPHTSGCRHYRLIAEIRHVESRESGFVGLYFAGITQRLANRNLLSFVAVEFNDLQDARNQLNRLPPEVRKLIPIPKANMVTLRSRYLVSDPRGWGGDTAYAQPQLFHPAGHSGTPGAWRTIVVEVSPPRIRVLWDGLRAADLDRGDLEKALSKSLVGELRNKPDDPVVPLMTPRVNLEGGLGLVLQNGYASFRNVRFEPLDADGN